MRDRRVGLLDRSRLRRAGAAATLVAVALTAARSAADDASVGQISGPARPPLAPELAGPEPDVAPLPPLVDGPARPAEADLPAEEGGTHRTWFALGTWWAVLPDPVSGVHRIWGLPGPDGPWVDTGTLVDERPFAQVEVVWDGEDLVVAAWGGRAYRSHALRVHRMGWSASDGRWAPDPDHPIEVTTEGERQARLAVTDDGTAWLVRPRGTGLEVARSTGRAARWSGWSALPVEGGDVGGFDVVTQGAEVVVVTRRVGADALVVTRRRGEAWSSVDVGVPGIRGIGSVDAAAASGGGPVAVLVPTTAEPGAAGDQATALVLAVVPSGDEPLPPPTVAVVSRVRDGLTRAGLVVDGDRARVVAVAPPSADEVVAWQGRERSAPTALVEKEASLSEPFFTPGPGRRLMSGVDGAPLGRPLLPASVEAGSGVVAIASGSGATRWSTWTEGVEPAPRPPAPAGAGDVTVLVDDTFDTLTVGGPGPTSWVREDTGAPVGEVVDDRTFASRALRLAGGPDPASACRSIPELAASVVTVEAVLRPAGTGTADARLLTVRGPGGSVASVRLSRLGLAGWSTPQGRVTGWAAAPPGAALLVTIRLTLAARTADITVRSAAGTVLAEGAGIPWSTAGGGGVDELCVRPAPGAATVVVVDSVRVTQR